VLPFSTRPAVFLAVLLSTSLLGSAPLWAAPTPTGATGLHERMLPASSPDHLPAPQRGRSASLRARSTAGLLLGPDVASYQHPNGATIDWKHVAASGQTFAIIKGTELYTGSDNRPSLYRNPYLGSDLSGAETAGLVVGSYAFAHPENDPRAQADGFAQAVGALPSGSLPPILDLEVSGGLSVPQLIAWTHTFLDRLASDTGIIPMIYTGPSFWNSALGGTSEFSTYPLWQATYTSAAEPPTFGGWSSYTMWQYTDAASVPGISGSVDQTRFRGSRPGLTAIAQPHFPASLTAPHALTPYQSLSSHNRQYRLVMQGDGNLVAVGMGHPLWSSRTNGHPGARLALLPSGRAVVYSSSGTELWSTGGAQGNGAVLTLQDNGDLVLRSSAGPIWHNGAAGCNTLTATGSLVAAQYLHTGSGHGQLLMQPDGNLVLRRDRVVLWAAGTSGFPGTHLLLQPDGNLVAYDTSHHPRWASGTSGTGRNNRLVVQNDGNLVLYGPTGPLWSSHTSI
jgi:lysozyme